MNTIQAIFEDGVFRPIEPVCLPEKCRVELQCLPVSNTGSENETETNPTQEQTKKKRTIEEELQEIASEIPREEWEKLPRDLTDNLDHYIYGTPKQ